MKNVSVKTKIALWLTVLTVILWALVLIFMMSISSSVATRTATDGLSAAVRQNLTYVTESDGKPRLHEDFVYYHGGITTLVYTKSESLYAGVPPVTFTTHLPFENGKIRTVDSGRETYLVLDVWQPFGWDDGVWLRGITEAPDDGQIAKNLLFTSLIFLPVFVLLAAFGSYYIARRAFSPLDYITATAKSIGGERDLSRRIALSGGKNEFYYLADTFDELFDRLEAMFEAEKQFASDASHELRTPVSVIKGACEYSLKYDRTEDERRESLEMIARQTERMQALISQLLSLTRLEQGTEAINFSPTDLGELIRQAVESSPHNRRRIVTDIKDGVTANVDATLICRAFENLLDNAFKYSEGGNVYVSVRADETCAHLCVRDEGIGIAESEQEKIWQRFYRVDPSRGESDGAGLGLYMVEQIAKLHEGKISLTSAPGAGSSFTMSLPL